MVSLKKLIGALLLVLIGYLTMSCDDFFSPTVEVFINHLPEKAEVVVHDEDN